MNDGTSLTHEIVGPFFAADEVTRWLSIATGALDARIAANEIIACALADGAWVFPIWQFADDGVVHPNLLEVWQVLRRGADPWTCGTWMCTPFDELGGQSPVQWLVGRGDVYPVLACARADADRWIR